MAGIVNKVYCHFALVYIYSMPSKSIHVRPVIAVFISIVWWKGNLFRRQLNW